MFDQLSVLACATGLLLIAAWFAMLGITGQTTDQLAMIIAAVTGFEIHLYGRVLRRRFIARRAGGKRG
ncbi:MAG: hypothetical protein H7241_08345 [Novosphingobium sp.]|nr:hypothetical protein [Novosphingobium sp.]